MFVIKKKIKGKEYFYLRETRREGGKIKSKTIAYLGKNEDSARERFNKLKEEKESMKEEKKIGENKKIEKEAEEKLITIEEIASFCKRKGFVFPSSEIIEASIPSIFSFS